MKVQSEDLLNKEAREEDDRSAEDADAKRSKEQNGEEQSLPVRAVFLTARWFGYIVLLVALFAASAGIAAGVAVLLNRLLGWPLTWL
jgi:hypothetical protein